MAKEPRFANFGDYIIEGAEPARAAAYPGGEPNVAANYTGAAGRAAERIAEELRQAQMRGDTAREFGVNLRAPLAVAAGAGYDAAAAAADKIGSGLSTVGRAVGGFFGTDPYRAQDAAPAMPLTAAPAAVAAPRETAMPNTTQRQGLVSPAAVSAPIPNPVAAPMREPLPDVVRGTVRTSYDERGFEKPRLTMAQYVDLYKSVYGTDTQAKTDRYKADTQLDIAKEEGKNRIAAVEAGLVRSLPPNVASIAIAEYNRLGEEYRDPQTTPARRAEIKRLRSQIGSAAAGLKDPSYTVGN